MQNPPTDFQIDVASTIDIVTARQKGREIGLDLGFSGADVTLIAAAISEIARNILDHAKGGRVDVSVIQQGSRKGIQIVAQDGGPGIPDIEQAMQYGFSTRKGLGVGLPGAKWLMDDFDIRSAVGKGTTITMRKWLRNGS